MIVLLVEDEVRLADNIAVALREGPHYVVDIAHDGEEALLFCSTRTYDAIILDLMLPQKSGTEVLTRLRLLGVHTPVLVLTAVGETAKVIELLNLGADDYLGKPFDLGELIARVRAVIRRGKGIAHTVLRFGSIAFNTSEQHVSVDGIELDISPTELRILEYLMHRPRMIVSPRELLEHLFDFTWASHSNVIEVHISNLRKKLRRMGTMTTLENIRGRGYRLSERYEP